MQEIDMTSVELQRHIDQLARRAQELDYVAALSDLIEQPGLSLDQVLDGAVRLLPLAVQFPQAAGARIIFHEREFSTDTYRETEWRLAADLVVRGQPSGHVEVCYLGPMPWGAGGPFTPEEHSLLRATARRLGWAIERLQAGQELNAQRKRLDLVLDNVPAYVAYMDPDLNILHVNRSLADWLGRTKEQVAGKRYQDVARPGGYEQNAPYLRQALASCRSVTSEFRTTSAAGESVIARAICVPHLDEQGDVQGLVVLLLDVTEQRRVEAELRTQQQRLDLIIDNLPAYIVLTDAAQNILHANRAYAGFWGHAKEEILGKHLKEVASPKAYQELAGYLEQVAASRQTVLWEAEVESPGAQTFVMRRSYVPHLDEQGNVAGFVALILDVTAQRQAEETLRASQERYRLVVENMRDGVVTVDEAGKITYVNDRVCEMTGRSREDLLGQRSAHLFFGDERQRHQDQLARRRAGFSDVYESVFVHQDGSKLPVLISASPMIDPQGDYRGGFAVVADITVHKRVEQALRQAKEAAEVSQAAAERARFEEQQRRHESERRQRLAEGLADVLAALNAKRPLDDVLNLVVRQARRLLGAQAAAIYAQEGPEEVLRVRATQGLIGALFAEASTQAIRAVLREGIAQGRPVARGGGTAENGEQAGYLAAPILLGERAYGALVVYRSGSRPISGEDLEFASLLAAQAALAVENARLRAEVEEAAITAERTRLARDLHDSVTQALFSASLISETLPVVWRRRPHEAQQALDELHRLTHGALAEMRTLLLELRPAALLAQPLDALIGQLMDSVPARTRTPVIATVAGDLAVPQDVKLAVYRIAQEALNNVVKHAHASQVRVNLRGDPGHLTLSVSDDGRGFDPAGVGTRQLGLGIMRERALGVGAPLSVESRPGGGTTVTVSWSAPGMPEGEHRAQES